MTVFSTKITITTQLHHININNSTNIGQKIYLKIVFILISVKTTYQITHQQQY